MSEPKKGDVRLRSEGTFETTVVEVFDGAAWFALRYCTKATLNVEFRSIGLLLKIQRATIDAVVPGANVAIEREGLDSTILAEREAGV